MNISPAFKQNVVDLHGEKGEEWLGTLPDQISEYEKLWNVKIGEPFPLSYNFAAPAQLPDGGQAVIKIGFPRDTSLVSEFTALTYFNGEGAVKILEEDIANAVMLLERALPGTTLDQLHDNRLETKIACNTLKMLWKDATQNNNLITLEHWYKGFERVRNTFNGKSGPIPEEMYKKGETLFGTLLETTTTNKLLHGDFHHHNMLSSQRDEWLAIDPKGVIGDPAYDVSVFLYNPIPQLMDQPNVKELVTERITIFSEELGIDRTRIIQWGIAQSILSAAWTVEDHGEGWEYGVNFAGLLSSL